MALNKDMVELIIFQGKLFSAVGFALEDGKVTFTDALYFKDAVMAAIPAYNGINNVKISDLKDPENRAEAVAVFSDEFDIPQEEVEELVEEGLELAMRNYEFAQKMVRAIKGPEDGVEDSSE